MLSCFTTIRVCIYDNAMFGAAFMYLYMYMYRRYNLLYVRAANRIEIIHVLATTNTRRRIYIYGFKNTGKGISVNTHECVVYVCIRLYIMGDGVRGSKKNVYKMSSI